MQRQEALLAVLGVPDQERVLLRVEIVTVCGDRFAHPDAGGGQKPDQGLVGGHPQRRAKHGGCLEQGGHLGGGIQIRCGPRPLAAQQPGRGDLGGRVDGAQVGGEAADHRQALGLPGRGAGGTHRPGQGVLDGDRGRCVRVQVVHELCQVPARVIEYETQ